MVVDGKKPVTLLGFLKKKYYLFCWNSQVFSHFYADHKQRCTLSKSGMLINFMARPKIRRSCWIDSTWQLSRDRCKNIFVKFWTVELKDFNSDQSYSKENFPNLKRNPLLFYYLLTSLNINYFQFHLEVTDWWVRQAVARQHCFHASSVWFHWTVEESLL